ncbi:MAG TPA: hypothetical protein VJ978_14030 [Nitriliruptoraceae bacterium]|nr:hypothetical protein [Nitriliruptoraceae bacterium]
MWPPVTAEQEALAEAGRRRVLSGDPYLDEPGLLERFGEWLSSRFGDLGGSADSADSWLAALGRLLDAAAPWVLAGLALGAAWWLWRSRRAVAGGAKRTKDRARVDHHARDGTAAEWLSECRRLADDEQYTEAVRAAYRAIVTHLVDEELVPATPGLTVGAHRGLVGHSEVIDALQAEGFAEASDVFERVWYAPVPRTDGPSGVDMTDDVAADPHGHAATVVTARPATARDVDVVVAAATRLGVR